MTPPDYKITHPLLSATQICLNTTALPNGSGTNEHALKMAWRLKSYKLTSNLCGRIDQSKGTPAADKKTDPEKAKAFLFKCYTTASISLKVLDESSSYNFTGLSAEDTRKLLTKSIQLNMKQLKATDVLASKHVMLIARYLMKLQETFGN